MTTLTHKPTKRDHEIELVEALCRFIEASSEPPTLAELSDHAHMSTSQIHRVFKRVLGVTPRQYADACRLKAFRALLKQGMPITQALYEVGYGSSSRVYEQVPSQIGMTPSEYQRGGAQIDIHYIMTACPLGMVLVAATERGVCAICLGNDEAELEHKLRLEYPAANITADATGLEDYIATVLQYMEGNNLNLDLPLDIQVTAFQRRVLDVLRKIPYGETRSYSDIARAIGNPRATRAVAQACKRNPVALVIPCHRVIQKDGKLGGYAAGAERKAALLNMESQSATDDDALLL